MISESSYFRFDITKTLIFILNLLTVIYSLKSYLIHFVKDELNFIYKIFPMWNDKVYLFSTLSYTHKKLYEQPSIYLNDKSLMISLKAFFNCTPQGTNIHSTDLYTNRFIYFFFIRIGPNIHFTCFSYVNVLFINITFQSSFLFSL